MTVLHAALLMKSLALTQARTLFEAATFAEPTVSQQLAFVAAKRSVAAARNTVR